MNLTIIKEILEAKVIIDSVSLDNEIGHAIASDLMNDILHTQFSAGLLITRLTNNQTVRTCEIAGNRAIIFVRSKKPDNDAVRIAESCNIPLLSCDSSLTISIMRHLPAK